jgi:hypothetical protein
MKKKTNNTRVKKRKRTTMGKSLPRGGMTVATVCEVHAYEVHALF